MHWYDQLRKDSYRRRYKDPNLINPHKLRYNMSFGLPTSEAFRVCKRMFRFGALKPSNME